MDRDEVDPQLRSSVVDTVVCFLLLRRTVFTFLLAGLAAGFANVQEMSEQSDGKAEAARTSAPDLSKLRPLPKLAVNCRKNWSESPGTNPVCKSISTRCRKSRNASGRQSAWAVRDTSRPSSARAAREYERTVLIGYSNGINHERHLCKVMLDAETRYAGIYERVMELLDREYFKDPKGKTRD